MASLFVGRITGQGHAFMRNVYCLMEQPHGPPTAYCFAISRVHFAIWFRMDRVERLSAGRIIEIRFSQNMMCMCSASILLAVCSGVRPGVLYVLSMKIKFIRNWFQ